MEPARSALFVPGNRTSWVRNAADNDADVVVLDLEDSVPPADKDEARSIVADAIPDLHDDGQRVYVRINGHPNDSDGLTERDLESVVCDGLEGVVVPKLREPNDVQRLDAVLEHVERRDGLQTTVDVMVTIETAQAMRQVYELCTASERVATISCGAVKGTDTNYALGFEWTGPGREGLETVHLREQALLDARAAGIAYPMAGTYVDVEDIEGLRADMQFAREMGYAGYVVIHPSHVEHANELFLPDADEIEYWLGARAALLDAREDGKSAVRYEGDMVDTANLQTVERYLEYARAFESELELDVDDIPEFDEMLPADEYRDQTA